MPTQTVQFSVGFDRVVNIAQLFALVSGLAWLGIEAGKRDERLAFMVSDVTELRGIVTDLTKAQIAGATAAAGTTRELDALRNRIERLEINRRDIN